MTQNTFIQPQIQSTQGLGAVNGVKILGYGLAGMGKTRLCATAPNPFILSAESGLLSLNEYNLPFVAINNIDDMDNMYNWFAYSTEARQFQTICIDSLSEIGEVVLANAKATVKDPRQAYGELIERMTLLIRKFRDIPGYHVYFSAKQEYIKDEATGITMHGPSMPGKALAQQLPYFFDEVLQLTVGKAQSGETFNYLRTKADFSNVAKDRSGKLALMEEPNLTTVINKILNIT